MYNIDTITKKEAEQLGITDAVLIFINVFLSTHNKTVTREELLFILTTFQNAIKSGVIKAKHPLATIANQTQDKLVKVLNTLQPKEKIKLQISDKDKIENKILGLHGLGFWNVIAAAVVGKAAEHITHKHLTKTKDLQTLSGIDESVFDELADLYEASFDNKNAEKKVVIGELSEHTIKKIKEATGKDFKGYKIEVKASEIKHTIKMHGKAQERFSNQKPIDDVEEFLMYPIVINNCDTVEFQPKGLKNKFNDTLVFTKKIGNKYFVVNEIFNKSKVLRYKTMYIKKPSTQGIDGIKKPINATNKVPLSGRPKREFVNSKIQKKSISKTQNTLNGITGFTRADKSPEVKAPDTFKLNGELGKLLGDIQPYKYSIVLTGDPHAGKTEFTMQLANGFSEIGKTVGAFMLEQGGLESKDTKAAIERNITDKNKQNVFVTGEANKGIETVKEFANKFNVIIIDSWQKLGIPSTKFDSLRHEFPNTIFIVIFQQNGEGGTRGGVVADYDTPVLLKVHKVDSTFTNNYVEVKKNRGNSESLAMHYMVKSKKTVNAN